MNETKFRKLRLSAKNTNNGSGFDILYDFGENFSFVEFDSKNEFLFIQPWCQFPNGKYTDECMRVSIELVHRFNQFEELEKSLERYKDEITFLVNKVRKFEREEYEREIKNNANTRTK